ncbi:two-component response regulator [Gemella morbillorum]|uniref:LytTR family transcriptional regulator n=2 Tax=Gemella morbillorum TaxID=29391 RepID=A0A2X4NCF7_9BACL|nr:LytTR family DNA-binding domain-containing protein [Gemella morbillorum]EFV35165.1 LytTr DNA-binding domain-containing protein [Gemella morbillorum M424]MDK8254872.1 LytTR family DNA-binding domain-containing protein [Gemella morbillorum]QGS08459.1 LytTR family transcriptional regulator [Gemella morbillorum]UBH80609.1 LytTR family transcriptional regulator [Gemella morbillorum]SQH56009.1 two-component response regulator [Gemella morbillorum]
MKLELNIDEKVKETLVVVSANKIDKEVQNLINYIEYSSEYLIGIVEDKASIIDIGEIIRVYIEDRKTFVVTLKDTYVVKKKLYEVENMVTRNFIKISQSEIANIKFIKNLDFSNTGTIVIKYKNSDISYVSRRMIKEFKLKLGI